MSVVAIMSIGEMGLGIGSFLKSEGYRVITNLSARSPRTVERARDADIDDVQSDVEIASQGDYFLSIVPPRDSLSMAERFCKAFEQISATRSKPFYYLDLNATSPATASAIGAVFARHSSIKHVDGGIIGGPPEPDSRHETDRSAPSWKLPSIPISGPHEVPGDFARTLKLRSVGDNIGQASGLKMCFAALNKGYIAIAVQSLTTAKSLGLLGELKAELSERGLLNRIEAGVATCPPKAYRWVREMEEIADTFGATGFGERDEIRGGDLFRSIAEVYRFIAEDTQSASLSQTGKATDKDEEVLDECLKSLKQ